MRRRRGRAAAPSAADVQLARQLRALVRVLRNQPGIPVRQPAHVAPPFRAIPINAWGVFDVTATSTAMETKLHPIVWSPYLVGGWANTVTTPDPNAGAPNLPSVRTPNNAFGPGQGVFNTTDAATLEDLYLPANDFTSNFTSTTYATGSQPFPDGYLGFITGLQCAYFNNAPTASTAFTVLPWINKARFSWFIDNQPVPGFVQALPGIDLIGMDPAVAGTLGTNQGRLPSGGHSGGNQLGCPVQIRPGQRSYMAGHVIGQSGDKAWKLTFVFRLTGYMIPSKTDDTTILGTLGD